MRMSILAVLFILSAVCAHARAGESAMAMSFENDYLRIEIGPDARIVTFADRQGGRDYSAGKTGRPVAWIKKDGWEYDATSAVCSNGQITVGFGDSKISAVIGVKREKHYLVFEVVRVSDEHIDELTFAEISLKLTGTPKEPFAACALALNLETNVNALPCATSHLQATCYPRFGLAGAKVALIGCPTSALRAVMKEVVSAAPDLPHSSLGGPWALDSAKNRGSYMFNFGDMTEKNVDQWIKLVKDLGITQIDFHGGGSFRFGDCVPNPKWYPNGRASFKAVIDKLHAAGILAGLHTYAFFMDKHSKWVSPVPDPRLGSDATFTLAKPLSEDDKDTAVVEPTKDMSTVTGFFVWNSVILRVDDELISFSGVSKEKPYAFTGCTRGAFGTKVSAHAAGSKAYHLKECFGYLTPDPDSTLFTEVAAATADFYNECGFDMIYLDALDGEGILAGPENGWHYGSKFVFEIEKRLKKPAVMEMSTFHHHLWYVRSRMGAWDTPSRSLKKFIDVHAKANEFCQNIFLPSHLGWWSIISGPDPRQDPTFPDDIEYLCCKCVGNDCGFSPQGFSPEAMAKSQKLQRLGAIMKHYEDLRHANYFTEAQKAKLRVPGEEYTLVKGNDGSWQLREIQYEKHKVESAADKWTTWNKFGAQDAKLRIYALNSAGPYDSSKAVTLVDFKDPAQFSIKEAAPGVTASLEPSTAQQKECGVSGRYTATWKHEEASALKGVITEKHSIFAHGTREVQAVASWTRMGAVFSPTKDLSATTAMGVWVHGDGQGEVLNLQLRSPAHLNSAVGDYYVVIDFIGWKYFELVEPEGARIDDYAWPYSGNMYSLYREWIYCEQVESLNVWLNDLPANKTAVVYLSPVKALPMVKTKLTNPAVTVNGKTITFPVEIPTGSYLEYKSATDCKLYNSEDEFVAEVKPQGDALKLTSGSNNVTFGCQGENGVTPRAYVSVISEGKVLQR